MKIQFKLLSLLLALVILLSACGPAVKPDETTNAPAVESTQVTTEAPTEEPTEEPTEKETEKPTEKVTEVTTEKIPEETLESVPADEQIKFSRDEYSLTKKDIVGMYTLTQEDYDNAIALLNAFVEEGLTNDNYDEVDAAYLVFEDAFYHIQTQSSIANVIYYCDTTDEEAKANHLFADEKIHDLQDEYIEACRKLYEESPHKDELFADWTEEDIKQMLDHDPVANELRKRNEEIVVEANALPELEKFDKIPELYVEFIQNNQKLAALYGYDNYYDYATKEVYGRDYTSEDLETFKNNFLTYLYPNESLISKNWNALYNRLSYNKQTTMVSFLYDSFDKLGIKNYLIDYVNNTPGGLGEAMRHMFKNKNLIITDSRTSHQSAFQTYFPEFEHPFCLFGSDGQSSTTIAHEMGHYYAALTNHDLTSLDLMETHSQANEYLFLIYTKSKMASDIYSAMMAYNMYNSYLMLNICLIVDEFERRVYSLESVEGFTSADFDAIIEDICLQYGGIGKITNSITDIKSYWRQIVLEAPVYYISYAVSSIEALNIYAVARDNIVKGHEVYKYIVEDAIPEDAFLITLEKAGLSSPFDEETMKAIATIMIK